MLHNSGFKIRSALGIEEKYNSHIWDKITGEYVLKLRKPNHGSGFQL